MPLATQRILYTGPFRLGSMTESRRLALIELGHQVTGLDQAPFLDSVPGILRKVQMHALIGPGIVGYNRALLAEARALRPDMIYVDTGSYLWPETVSGLRETGAMLVHYISEDFRFRQYFYRHFRKAVATYDAQVITHPPSREYLEQNGARRIIRTEFGYDPTLHRPVALTSSEVEKYQSDAVFVGHWEPTTERMIAALRSAGVQARVWGPGWHRASSLKDRDSIRPIYGEEYIKVLCAARLCLCFLSKWGRNTWSVGRTFEIPAAGRFLLAERTEEHQRYYREGVEAEFFGSAEELVEKAQRYLSQEDRRLEIAAAGHHRCLTSRYSHRDRCDDLMQQLLSA